MKPETTRISENRCNQCGTQIVEECDEQGLIHGQCPAWNGSNGHSAYSRGQTLEEMEQNEISYPSADARKTLMSMARARRGPTIAYIDIETGEIVLTLYPLRRGEWRENEPPNSYEVAVPRNRFFSYRALDELIEIGRQLGQEASEMM